jgi:hypothetical protein
MGDPDAGQAGSQEADLDAFGQGQDAGKGEQAAPTPDLDLFGDITPVRGGCPAIGTSCTGLLRGKDDVVRDGATAANGESKGVQDEDGGSARREQEAKTARAGFFAVALEVGEDRVHCFDR